MVGVSTVKSWATAHWIENAERSVAVRSVANILFDAVCLIEDVEEGRGWGEGAAG